MTDNISLSHSTFNSQTKQLTGQNEAFAHSTCLHLSYSTNIHFLTWLLTPQK